MAAPQRIFPWFLVFSYFISIGVQATDQNIISIEDKEGNTVCIRLERVGCYRDERPFRALRNFYYTGRKYINWTTESLNTTAIIRRCAENAYKQGYKTLFGVQYYGECWSDGFAEERYDKYGVSSNCEHGVGKNWANMVYRLSVV